MPTMATNDSSVVSDIGSSAIACSSPSPTSRAANASTRRPCSPIRSFAASIPARVCSIGCCEPLSGPPDSLQRASTTSGAPLTSSITCSAPSSVTR